MAANSLVNSTGWGLNNVCTSTQGQALQVQGGQSVNRTNTISGSRALPLIINNGATVEITTSASDGTVYTTDVNGWPHAMPLVGLPNGHLLTGVRLWILPNSTSRSGEVATKPVFKLFKKESVLTAAATLLGMATATWASEAAYEAGEGLLVTGLTETINLDTHNYFIVFTGETGANAYAGLTLCGLDAIVTIDTAYGGQDLTQWRKA